MGDPLSVAASVAGLISLALQTTQYLCDYYTACRDQHKDLARIADRLDDLRTSLRLIDEIVTTRKWAPDQKATIDDIERSVSRCEDVINELQNEAQKFRKEPTDSLPKLIRVAGRRVAYPFRRSTLEKLQEDIDDFRINLTVTLQALQLQEAHKAQDELGEIVDILKLVQAQSLSENVRNWLKAPDATVDYNAASNKRHPGTGMWFIKSSAFVDWLHNANSFLWIRGLAGCGKSVLCSTAIQHTFRHCRSQPESAIAFFFFTFSDSSKQDASALVRTLLLQLASQINGLGAELAKLQKSHHYGTPPVPVLLEYLQQAVVRARDVHILIDALDESPVDNERAEVLSAIQTMRDWSLSGLRLLVTSRHTIDIEQGLECSSHDTIAIRTEDVDPDILSYVSHQVDHDRQLQRWGEHREKIKQYLAEHSGGMFRWVECQLGPLRKCPQSLKHLQKCLESLPKSLDATYERMLNDIGEESKDEAYRILLLLCFSPRPMTVAEIIDALAVDLDAELYDSDSKLQNSEDLRRICSGLIEIDVRRFDRYTYEHYPNLIHTDIDFIRVAHFSVQEYLLSDRIRQSPASGFALLGNEELLQISKICLIYLHNENYLHGSLRPSLVEEYPFGRFAAKYWHHYYKLGKGAAPGDLERWIMSLFTSSPVFTRWMRLFDPDSPSGPIYYDWVSQKCKPPMYYTALLGLDDIVFAILRDESLNVSDLGKYYESALRAAMLRNNEDLVRTLLTTCMKQADVFRATLEMAAETDNKELVQALLPTSGIDNNREIQTPINNALTLACQKGHLEVAQILIAHGVDIFASSSDVQLAAAPSSDTRMPEHAPNDQVADIERREKMPVTPLLAALRNKHQKVAQLLIDNGADANVNDKHFTQALEAASEFGYVKIVQALIQRISAATAHNQKAYIALALFQASLNRRAEVVRILLEYCTDKNLKDVPYGPATHAALSQKDMHTAMILICHDAAFDLRLWNQYSGAVLHHSVRYCDIRYAMMLLDKGIDPNAVSESPPQSALEAASIRDYPEMVQLLLDRGARPNERVTATGRTALSVAVNLGYNQIVRILVENGASVDARARYDTSAMASTIADRRCKNDVVKILPKELAPLALASLRCHNDVVMTLLQHGARLDASDYKLVAEAYQWRPYRDMVDTAQVLDDAHPERSLNLVSPTREMHDKVYRSRTRDGSRSLLSRFKSIKIDVLRHMLTDDEAANSDT